jgi:hypothetical protein
MWTVTFLETSFTSQTDSTVVRYSPTINDLPSNSQFNFSAILVKVNCMKERVHSYLHTRFLYLMEDAFVHFSLYDKSIYRNRPRKWENILNSNTLIMRCPHHFVIYCCQNLILSFSHDVRGEEISVIVCFE